MIHVLREERYEIQKFIDGSVLNIYDALRSMASRPIC